MADYDDDDFEDEQDLGFAKKNKGKLLQKLKFV